MKKENWIKSGLNFIVKEIGRAVYVFTWKKKENRIRIVCFRMGPLMKHYIE